VGGSRVVLHLPAFKIKGREGNPHTHTDRKRQERNLLLSKTLRRADGRQEKKFENKVWGRVNAKTTGTLRDCQNTRGENQNSAIVHKKREKSRGILIENLQEDHWGRDKKKGKKQLQVTPGRGRSNTNAN